MNHQAPDPEKLEEGLRRLRELGYLQGPAERYAARKVPAGASNFRVAGAMGFWVGAVGGAGIGLILTLSALLADPRLLDRPTDLAWLGFDLVLLAAGAGLLFTVGFTALVLRWFRHSGHKQGLERALLWVPGLIAALYLTDRLARHLLPRWGGAEWWMGAAAVVLLAAAIAAMGTLVLGAMMATARLQWKGVWKPQRLGPVARWLPGLAAALGSVLLLGLGPYAALRPLPYLDEIRVSPSDVEATPLLIVALDGLEPPREPDWSSVPLEAPARNAHPAAFWNVLSTGFDADAHGLAGAADAGPRGLEQGLGKLEEDPVLSLVLRHVLPGVGLGAVRATDQRELRRPPFWEILAQTGVPSTVVNWWATYPAARHEGLRVASDRALLRLLGGEAIDLDAAVPRELLDRLVELESAAWVEWPELGEGLTLLEARAPDVESLREAWTLAMVADRVHLECAVESLAPAAGSRLAVVFLNGADILRRATSANLPEDVARALEQRHDRWLRSALEASIPPGIAVWTVAGSSVDEGRARRLGWSGPPVVGPRALAPAVLRHFGVPPARDMEGADPSGPATYGRRPRWTPEVERSEGDLERLRSLGYIGG